MKRFTLHAVAWLVLAGWLPAGIGPVARAQQAAPSRTQQEKRISDRDLRAFTKVYVAYQSLRKEYEPRLKNAPDPKEKEAIQQEANSKLKKVLQQQRLTAERYNQIFAAVNADEQLRERALSMIQEERKKS